MRWKLVLITSLLATLVGAGATLGIIYVFFGSGKRIIAPGLLGTSALIIPLATIIFASIFVYRHTARRRRLQAFMTALLAVLLTLTVFILSSWLMARPAPAPEPLTTPRNIG